MIGDEVQVRYACSVTFAIGEDYKDIVWCDVLPMDSDDILLGRPWMYDNDAERTTTPPLVLPKLCGDNLKCL